MIITPSKEKPVRTLTLAMLMALFLVPATSRALTTISATEIFTNTLWGAAPADSVYLIQPSTGTTLTILSGATLTIQPGTRLKFAANVRLVVAGATAGSLSAIGTPSAPIIFEANSGLAGGWWGIDFTTNSDLGGATSTLDNCILRHGGLANGSGYQVRVTNSNTVTLHSCWITAHKGAGLGLSGASGAITNCTFDDPGNSASYPVSGDLPSIAGLFPNNTFVRQPAGGFAAFQVTQSDLSASLTLPTPPANFCYITATGDDILVGDASQPVLTISPGTLVKFATGSQLRVGSTAPGALVANNVVFTSAPDDTLGDSNGDGLSLGAPGQWEAIRFESFTMDTQTQLTNCSVRFGGSFYDDEVQLVDADPTVANCRIERSSGVGLIAFGNTTRATGVHGNLLRDNNTQELGGTVPALQRMVPTNDARPSTNGRYNAYLIVQTDLTTSATLPTPPANFCYITATGDDILVDDASQPVLTISPGTLVKFATGSQLRVGSGAPGALVANYVVFTSTQDDTLGDSNGDGLSVGAPGQWEAVRFLASTMVAQTDMTGCSVRFGGSFYNTQLQLTGVQPAIVECQVERGKGSGLNMTSGTGTPIHGNIFSGNTGYDLSAPIQAMCNLVALNMVRPHPKKARNCGLEVRGGSVVGIQTLPSLPTMFAYAVTSTVSVPAGQALTIQPGTVIKFGAGLGMTVNGTLSVQGQVVSIPQAPVVFTALSDDTWSGDTAGDGATAGSAFFWTGLSLSTGSNSSVIQGAIFRYGAGSGLGQVEIASTGSGTNPAVNLQNCHFYLDADNPIPGGLVTVGSYAHLDHCSFFGPKTRTGITNLTPTTVVDAPNCWWGDPSGPFDQLVGNPCTNAGGLGVGVSDGVNYCPVWLTSQAPVTGVLEDHPFVARTAFVAVGPIPSRGEVWFTLDVAPGASSTLEVLDASGRRVRSLDLSPSAGRRDHVRWDGRDQSGQAVRPGVYFARLVGTAAPSVRRLIILD